MSPIWSDITLLLSLFRKGMTKDENIIKKNKKIKSFLLTMILKVLY
ncbi:hypothetical protein SORDD27_00076 [Streptococcus oralis]|uniref:Uncharacterized protein n=1 Tax=Streptococcus oralis TaxID=1303 RepID=A0A139Q2H9_STROR|nr:hypothetical protein SORDD27_00076 [Streptococcus oralis]